MPRPSEPTHNAILRDITPYLVYVVLVAALGPLQFGYHIAELNAPQDVITCEIKSITSSKLQSTESKLSSSLPQCIPMTNDQFAVVTSIFTLGGFLGAITAGSLCSRYGRARTMRLTTISFILGPILECFAPSLPLLSFGRLVSGVGAGSAVVVVPIYISEVAPPEGKGLFGALTQIFTNVGIVLTQTLGYFLSRDNMWRIILAVGGVIGIIHFLCLCLVPESPKWLAEQDHPQEAREILQRIRGRQADIEDECSAWNITNHFSDLAEEESLLSAPSSARPSKSHSISTSTHTKPVSIISALLNPDHRPATIAVVALLATQQLTGLNSIIMYGVSLLSSILPTTAALLTIFVSLLNLIVTIICSPLIDKLGRKACVLLSITGMGISSLLLATGLGQDIQVLAAVATVLFVCSFATGLGPVPFMMANELAAPEAVGAVQSWGLGTSWVMTFVISQFFPILNRALGEKGRVYYVFAGCAAVLGAFIAWWVPETKGKKSVAEVWGKKETRERLE